MLIKKPAAIHELTGTMKGERTAYSVKSYKDAKSFYADADSTLSDDTVMYEIYTYTEENAEHTGHLSWGLTVMYPVMVSGECNMTRGHFHEDTECAEFYYGTAGNGLLLLMDENGKTWAEEVFTGSLHYIKGTLAHRLVNTGDDIFKITACWPTAAGHDYEKVEEMPFPFRVFKNSLGIEIKPNGRRI